jgi:hypothetical protein
LERRNGLLTEVHRELDRETIIFFDKLGFGWVLDNLLAEELRLCHLKGENTFNRSLMNIIENLLENPGV